MDQTIYLPIIFRQIPGALLTFSGGPLYRAAIGSDGWYLRADGQISLGSNGAETFPLDPQLNINSIAAKGDTLFALAEDGVYKRSPTTLQWDQLNDMEGRFLSTNTTELWMTPIDAPNEVWMSNDETTWESKSQGLVGTIISPVLADAPSSAGYFVISEDGGGDALWRAVDSGGTLLWQHVDTIPGPTLVRSSGLFARVVDASTVLGSGIMVGGADGKLYEYRFYNSTAPGNPVNDGWVSVWDFGANNYPLPLVNQTGTTPLNEVAVINQNSGQITLYEGVIIENGDVPKREWQVKAFPFTD
ncbi:MAG: hypothetical protein U0175_21645 [Caldilineaceae bacterium]